MKICIPVQAPQGLFSTISRHFGTASHFLVVDTDSQEPTALTGAADGSCQCDSPLLTSLDVDAVICGGIGAGAVQRLSERGIKVYKTDASTVGASLALLKQGQLTELFNGTCGADHGQSGHACHAH